MEQQSTFFLPYKNYFLVGNKSQFYYKYTENRNKIIFWLILFFISSIYEWVDINNFLHNKITT